MADNPIEEAPPAAPAEEPAAPAVEAAAPAAEAAAPAVEAAAPIEAPLSETIPPETTAEVHGEIVEGAEELPRADGEEQPGQEGEEGEKPRDEGQETEKKANGPLTAEEKKRLKLEKYKKMLDLEKAALKDALKAAQAAEAAEAKKIRAEEGGSQGSYQSLASEGEESADDLEDLKTMLNDFDNIEPPATADSEDEDEESVTSEETPRPRLDESLKVGFLREFDSLPSISDISLDSDSVSEAEPEPVVQKSAMDESDLGNFVDGDGEEGEGESESESGPEADSAAGAIADAEENSESESIIIDDLPDETETTEKRVVIKEVEEDTMAMFTDAVETDVVAKPDERISIEEPFWYRLTADFLENLISTVVANAEKLTYAEHKLDKEKMIMGLLQEVEEHNLDKSVNTTVNNIVCDFYRRNGKAMNFVPLLPADAAKEQVRFRRALDLADSLMERVKLMKINHATSSHKAMMELNALTVHNYNEEQRLEDLMRKTLMRRDMDRLKRALDNDLRRMQDLRNQVSEKRYELNLNLHNLAFVDEKVAKFEKVTETLTISQMLCANESIIQLSKQLEEKCKDVAVMQSNYKKSMIEETCVREKRDMITYSLSKAKLKFDDRFERRNQLRKELTVSQLEHARLKAERARLEVKGGLLFKVELMYDYDKCMKDVLDKRENVKKLKALAADMTKRIFNLENEWRRSQILANFK